jgi:hypothetical protein
MCSSLTWRAGNNVTIMSFGTCSLPVDEMQHVFYLQASVKIQNSNLKEKSSHWAFMSQGKYAVKEPGQESRISAR